MNFENLGLSAPLLKAIQEQGYDKPTPIQAQAIPAVLRGVDLLAGAQTGTGKTAGFTLPMLQRLMDLPRKLNSRGRPCIRALVLTPTRELAAQVEESVRHYGRHTGLKSMVMFGGVGMQAQLDGLHRGVDVLVATPGRLLDHHQQGSLDLNHIDIFVLDEADRMLDMGFIHDIKKVLALLPQKKQSLLFSATFSDEIKALAERLLNHPECIEVARRNATADTVAQVVHPVGRNLKQDLLAHLINKGKWHQVLVFTRMKHGANRLCDYLNERGISAMAIHGNKSQTARTKALENFKNGELNVLVATDIAARGIDIDQLPRVVNFDLPNVPEDYVHRIGRTGRAGAQGLAVSLVCVDENGFMRDIEKLIRREVPKQTVAGFEPPAHEKPEPIVLGRMVIGEGAGKVRQAGRNASNHGVNGTRQGQGRSGQSQSRSAPGRSDRSERAHRTAGSADSSTRPGSPRPAGNRGGHQAAASGRRPPRLS
jgi:ATP-dependent RNA helicase RhlE